MPRVYDFLPRDFLPRDFLPHDFLPHDFLPRHIWIYDFLPSSQNKLRHFTPCDFNKLQMYGYSNHVFKFSLWAFIIWVDHIDTSPNLINH